MSDIEQIAVDVTEEIRAESEARAVVDGTMAGHDRDDLIGLMRLLLRALDNANGAIAELTAPVDRDAVARIIDPELFKLYDDKIAFVKPHQREREKRWAELLYGRRLGPARAKAEAILTMLNRITP